jgi:microcystin degradation protein MlrC
LTDGRYRHTGSYMTGYETSMGRTAVVQAGGVKVLLTSLRTMPFDAGQLTSVGIDPAKQRIIVAKSAIAWRAAYGGIAKRAITVDTPGIATSNLARLPYRRRPRPLYPLDRDGFSKT